MSQSYPEALSLSRTALKWLIRLNVLMGLFIAILLITSLVAETWVIKALKVEHGDGSLGIVLAMRLIMVIGIASVPITHIVLTRLKAMVETVSIGNAFVAENAARLLTIAWSILGLEILHLAVGLIAATAGTDEHPLDIDWNFSITRWLAVLLCFVLARVFEHGTRMREDLEGTV